MREEVEQATAREAHAKVNGVAYSYLMQTYMKALMIAGTYPGMWTKSLLKSLREIFVRSNNKAV